MELARNNVVSHIYPERESPGILGLHLDRDLPPAQLSAVRQALMTGRPVLGVPLSLIQGGRGLIARAQVLEPSSHPGKTARSWGLATIIIKPDVLFADAHRTLSHGVRLAIRDLRGAAGHKGLLFGEASVWDADPVSMDVPVPGGHWQLAAIPVGGWAAAPVRIGLLGTAGVVWLGLTLAVWTVLSWPVRLARAVDAATCVLSRAKDDLEREVAGRTRDLEAANQALRQNQAHYRAFLDATMDMVFIKDAAFRYLVVNRSLAAFLGRSAEEVHGLDDFALLSPSMAEDCRTSDKLALRGQCPLSLLQMDRDRAYEVRKFPVPLDDGTFGVGGLVRDVTEQLRVEKAVQDSESRLRDLRDNAPIGIFSVNPDGRYYTVNVCLARMCGYTNPETMLADVTSLQDHFFADPHAWATLRQQLDTAGTVVSQEKQVRDRSGAVLWISLCMRALRGAEQRPLRYEGFCVEITKRKQAEAALIHQERQLRVIFDNSPLGLVYCDSCGVVIKCNARFLDQMGTTAERVEGRDLVDRLPALTRSALQRALRGVPTQVEGEYVSITGGRHLYARAFFNPVDPGQASTELIVTVEDVSAQRESEAALRLLQAAVAVSPVSIVITDQAGAIEYVNEHFVTLTGYSPEEAQGQNPRLLKSGIHAPTFYQELWETLLAGRIWRGQFCNRKKNGELYWEDTSISPIRSVSGQITHFVAVKEDITERRNLEKTREDVERIMRHDLKAPLNSLINLPGIVADLGPLNGDQQELLAEIERIGTLMLDQINLSLDLYKMETGTYVPVCQRVDLTYLNQVVAGMLEGLAREQKVTITIEAPETQVFALADAVLCQSIFSNLLKNAIEASAAGETVAIRLTEDSQPRWSVHNLTPVPSAIRPVFFEKYTTNGKADGNGLGTYSARLMTECQGGSIALASTNGAGTTVTVSLPPADDAQVGGEDQAGGKPL